VTTSLPGIHDLRQTIYGLEEGINELPGVAQSGLIPGVFGLVSRSDGFGFYTNAAILTISSEGLYGTI
jgi:hypothetical protein